MFLAFSYSAAALAAAAPDTELKDETGATVIRYVIEVPRGISPAGTTDPARQVGLFLCFPEHDHPTGDELLPVRESLRRQGLSDQYVLIAGHPQARKFGPADHEPIRKLIAWAMQKYPINPRRIYMYGKGEGGKISGEFAVWHPQLVTAGISYSWGWWTMPTELQKPIDGLRTAPEFYMVLGLRDLSYHITTVRDTYNRVSAKGYHVIYREFEELGARTYHPPSNDDAIAWATRLRNKNVPPSAEEARLLKQAALGSVPAEEYFSSLALVGGVPAGQVVQKLLDSSDARVRAAAAETCSYGMFGEDTAAALGKKLTDSSPLVRRAAFRALAMYAQWRSEAAQQALIALATTPGKAVDPADRISAVDALGQAVRFQVKGVRQDPPVFAALVALLGDSDEEVRTMASNILEPIRDHDFRGDLGRPERKAPEGGWQHWLDEITAQAAGFRQDYQACGTAPASQAEPVAQFCKGGAYLLGRDFATGQPVEQRPDLAFQNTKRAAEQGYAPAEAALGLMYANGKGVEQNYVEAVSWWKKAAADGHRLAPLYAAMAPKSNPVPPPIGPMSSREHAGSLPSGH
ncbi:MAG TPA: HEAT repeat domain-containing protein [Bryobacteraceae bacterium]|nr:HEAT repeat domain-containing protein [Bryobacteraceae bacterium]